MKRALLFCFCALLLLQVQAGARPVAKKSGGKVSSPAAVKPPVAEIAPPTILVSFGRQSLRESDREQVELWLSNNSDEPLHNVAIEIAAPDFLHWHLNSCAAADFGKTLLVGQLPARSTAPRKLCVSTDSQINVGDFNVLFTLKYEWNAGASATETATEPTAATTTTRQAFVSVEKTLKVNLLGSESVAGVPLALAGLIVPGLFFWIFLLIWQTPVEKDFGKEIIYSVLISVGFVGVAYGLRRYCDCDWLKNFDISGGLGIKKLLWLAAAGFGLGNFIGCVLFAYRRYQGARLIHPSDITITKIEKIVRQNPGYDKPKTTVSISGGNNFRGSLSATNNGVTWLIGWLQMDVSALVADPGKSAIVAEVRRLVAEKEDLGLLRLARENKIELVAANEIVELEGGGETPRGMILNWSEDKLSGQPQREEDAQGAAQLLTVSGLPDA
jgi:hypothetical protein